jgi:hypothetical protein
MVSIGIILKFVLTPLLNIYRWGVDIYKQAIFFAHDRICALNTMCSVFRGIPDSVPIAFGYRRLNANFILSEGLGFRYLLQI